MDNSKMLLNFDSYLNYDKNKVINLFLEAFESNKENIITFLNNEKQVLDLLKLYNIQINSKQYKQIEKTLYDIEKLLKDKYLNDEEIKQHLNIQNYKPIDNTASNVILYILFIILIVSIFCIKKLSNISIL